MYLKDKELLTAHGLERGKVLSNWYCLTSIMDKEFSPQRDAEFTEFSTGFLSVLCDSAVRASESRLVSY